VKEVEVVCSCHAIAGLSQPSHHIVDFEPALSRLLQPRFKRSMPGQLCDEKGLAGGDVCIPNREDVRITQPSKNLRFVPLLASWKRRQEFDRNNLAFVRIKCFVHLALAASAETTVQDVTTPYDRRDHRCLQNRAFSDIFHPMRVAGIAIRIISRGRPAVRLAVLTGTAGAPSVETVEEFTSDDVDLPTQLHDIARTVGSRLEGLKVDRVILRRADTPTVASKKEGPQLRLLAEGAAASAARSTVVDTRIGSGREIGAWAGSDKAAADAQAVQVLRAGGADDLYSEAASAAIAGLNLP
jgi:hypothetical protein